MKEFYEIVIDHWFTSLLLGSMITIVSCLKVVVHIDKDDIKSLYCKEQKQNNDNK